MRFDPGDEWEFQEGYRCVNVVCTNHRIWQCPKGHRSYSAYSICAFIVRRDLRNCSVKFYERGVLEFASSRKEAAARASEIGTMVDYAFHGRLVKNLTLIRQNVARSTLERL